mgnify:CR=1 FL=1
MNLQYDKVFTFFLSFLLLFIVGAYYYCYRMEHVIFTVEQGSLVKPNVFSITSKCKSISTFTVTPYISIKLNSIEILNSALNSGYDTIKDCKTSSVRHVEILEAEKKVIIYMKNGQIQEINLFFSLM